jgi:hypothetical protein
MIPVCPKCGSRDVRFSESRTASERLAGWTGIRPIRCRTCRHRFTARIWTFSDLSYARCPKCLNMRLSTWSTRHYHVPFGRGFLLFFGGNPYRCENCRHNFVSLRRRKFRYTRSADRSEDLREDFTTKAKRHKEE